MKFLKGLGIFFLSLFAFLFIFLFSLSLITKKVVQKGVVGSVVRNVVIEEFHGENDLTKEDEENIDKFNKIVKTDDINELVDRFLKEYEESLDDDDYEVSEETLDFVIDLFVEYKDLISDLSHEDLTEKEIRSKETREGIREAINEILSESSEGNKYAIKIGVTSYNFFVSITFRIMMIFFTVVCLILIALIKKSYFAWMKNASSIFISVGILIVSMYFAIIALFNYINNAAEYSIVINPKFIGVLGISELVLGILFMIATIVTNKKKED